VTSSCFGGLGPTTVQLPARSVVAVAIVTPACVTMMERPRSQASRWLSIFPEKVSWVSLSASILSCRFVS
jgi:hypothetical protein